jgi:hypothetical protein
MTILHIIIRGKWKSPEHSSDRSKDDTHKIKEEILNDVGKYIFEKEVGKNPDLDIDPQTEKIILRGRSGSSKKIFETNLNADGYFIKLFVITGYTPYFYRGVKYSKTANYYAIPPDIEILSLLLEYILMQENSQGFFIEIVI